MTSFFKLSGSGNDFVALAEPFAEPSPERIRAWCRRGISLGADGVFLLRRPPGPPGETRGTDPTVVMDYYNADGLPADLCLNGTRCAAQLAFHLGWAGERVHVETPAGPVQARRLDSARVTLELPAPAEVPRELAVEAGGTTWEGWALSVGVPHFVLLWPGEMAAAPVAEAGPPLRRSAVFPQGANVNFVRFPEPGRMEIRTYERGVEEETLSCGSGILAGVAVGLRLGLARLPVRVSTRGGFDLTVGGEPGTPFAGSWTLAGDARVVAHGELLPEAELGPSSLPSKIASIQYDVMP